ncbi:MAG TPA: HAD family hydrolase [Gammaproteobacteria bacterium]|nr:HAD family hydrolase [Gammaproteobacteria bacterium]
MPLALFDLDNTLLAGDSDQLWGAYLAEVGAVDGAWYRQENARYYAAYEAGTLDIEEFLAFALRPLAEHPPARLAAWRAAFIERDIRPLILPAARALIERHRTQGDHPVIVTATNRFVTEPIAAALAVIDLIATEPEQRDGRYTGRVAGVPSFQHGKITRLRQWLGEDDAALAQASFYSDSANDLPLLRAVGRPVAVDPDPRLRAAAEAAGWPVISLRDGSTGR